MPSPKDRTFEIAVEIKVDGVPVGWDTFEVSMDTPAGLLRVISAHILSGGHDLDELATRQPPPQETWESVDPRKLSPLDILEVLMHGTEDEQRLLRMRIDAARAILN